MENKEFFPHLEIQIAEHCNLNCASCTHFSPLAQPSLINPDDFFKQLQKAYAIFRGHCKSLKIMGGEPLLHPEIAQLCGMARCAMPDIDLTVQTNGILLLSQSESFWKACHDYRILIRVTRYPVELNIEKINEQVTRFGVDLKYHPADGTVKSFNLYPLNMRGDGNVEENFYDCRMKRRYVLIKNGRLYPCPIVGNAEHFNKTFNQNMVCGFADSVSLDEIHSFWEYDFFSSKAIPFCRFCLPAQYRRNVGWAPSQKSIIEWT